MERESPTGQYREDSMCQAHNPTEQISAKSPHRLRQLPFGLWFFLSRKLLLTFKLHHYQLEGSQCRELEKQEMGICRKGDRGVGGRGSQGLLSPEKGIKKSIGCCLGILLEHSCSLSFCPCSEHFLKTPARFKKKKKNQESLGRYLVLLFPP